MNFYIIYKTKNCEYIAMQTKGEINEYIAMHNDYDSYDIYDKQLDILYSPK